MSWRSGGGGMPESVRVFIGHAAQDTAYAARLAANLRRAGAVVEVDATYRTTPEAMGSINAALQASTIFVLVLSTAALATPWVGDEMNACIVRYKQGLMRAPLVIFRQHIAVRDIPPLWLPYAQLDAIQRAPRVRPRVLAALGVDPEPRRDGGVAGEPIAAKVRVALTSIVVLSLVALGLAIANRAPEYHFRGGNGPGTLRWKVGASIGSDKPALAQGLLYFGTEEGAVRAVSIADGATRWTFQTGNQVQSSPAIADGKVYIGSLDGSIYALDAATGTQRWKFQTAGRIRSSPAVGDSIVYVGSDDHRVYALDTATGNVRWTFQTGWEVRSTLVITNHILYVAADDDHVYALNTVDGTLRWRRAVDGIDSASPVLADGILYLAARRTVYAFDATTGAPQWHHATPGILLDAPTVAGDTLYVGADDAVVYALSSTDGAQRWTFRTRDWVTGSPAVGNGVVYCASFDHHVYALDAVTGAQRWTFQTGWQVSSSPLLAAGVLYVGAGDGLLYALNT